MRLVSRILRHVKSERFVLHPLVQPISRQYSGTPHYSSSIRGFPAYVASKDGDGADRSLSETPENSQPVPVDRQEPDVSLVQQTRYFGRWRAILTDPHRLAIESDFARRGPAKTWPRTLLVDMFHRYGDFALWSCLLDYQKRVNGDLGVFAVWKGLWGRKSLYDVDGPLAPMFWRVILEAAVRSDAEEFLETVWIYSEWMYDAHGVKWPHLYSTVLSHFLRTHQHKRVLQWQIRLSRHFYPGPDEFARLVKQFATDKELHRFSTLQSLYFVNQDHKLYDQLVPYLYDLGESRLAYEWRCACLRLDDLPSASALTSVKPFLRYLRGYFPREPLHPQEEAAINDQVSESVGEDDKPLELSREFVNRVHGETFGISVKNYNDRLGAKWFASTWVSLNTAISTISALGIETIGPLSLQSIALREHTPGGVLARIDQLRQHGISVLNSNYLQMILYLAKNNDNELLSDLLRCDLHPDVFGDPDLQARLLSSMDDSSDWKTHRLLLVSQIITLDRAARKTANAIVRARFMQRDRPGMLRILQDMMAMKISIDHEQTELIFETLVKEAPSHHYPTQLMFFYLAVCRQLIAMEVPVPIRCWRKLLFILIRQNKLGEFEKLCFELVRLYTESQFSRPGFVPMHLEDVPEAMKTPLASVENLLGLYIPLDLPRRLPEHPLRHIIYPKMMRVLVRCTFFAAISKPRKAVPALHSHRHQPRDFHSAYAVRLLRMLRDRGVVINYRLVAHYIKLRLTTLYGPVVFSKRTEQIMKANNTLTLGEMKALVDEAWGEELLPPLEELRAYIHKFGLKFSEHNIEYLESQGKSRPVIQAVL
ncbi:hypothetical protein F5X96DRAFT_287134 [Biscogniauxia mediterranea]|nr:hypothetical protein F5X96DRAFT_287134 [Biscogniauxia mediterranea]